MTIKASSSRQIDALIANLSAENAVIRETAVARLTLLGARAVERLIAAAGSAAPSSARAAAWRALEGIGDSRALEPALTALASRDLEPEIGAGAAGVARMHLRGAHGAAALDRLAAALLDRTRHETVRLAALRALRELEPATIAPILASLSNDLNGMIRPGRTSGGAPGPPISRRRAAPRRRRQITSGRSRDFVSAGYVAESPLPPIPRSSNKPESEGSEPARSGTGGRPGGGPRPRLNVEAVVWQFVCAKETGKGPCGGIPRGHDLVG